MYRLRPPLKFPFTSWENCKEVCLVLTPAPLPPPPLGDKSESSFYLYSIMHILPTPVLGNMLAVLKNWVQKSYTRNIYVRYSFVKMSPDPAVKMCGSLLLYSYHRLWINVLVGNV